MLGDVQDPLMVGVKIRMKEDLAVMKEEGRKEREEVGRKRRIYSRRRC